jgi:methylaspartate mutase epsilon subunit
MSVTSAGIEPSSSAARPPPGSFGAYVSSAHAAGDLVVQPRMGMSDPERMRAGLIATKGAIGTTAGTITVDSYTRAGDHRSASLAVRDGVELNGYPMVAHGPATTRAVLAGVQDATFPVQVRHGSAAPQAIVANLIASGLDATEGGPVSYCLPYGRSPLRESVHNWVASCERLSGLRSVGAHPHIETFGGCMMGQLCPPGLLVAIGVLEALFFRQHGIASVSVSYAQQTNLEQDEEGIRALQRISGDWLGDIEWHLVVYGYMGVYPRTPGGARLLGDKAARLAVRTGAARLIVKTVAEAYRIPTVADNVAALESAARAAADEARHAGQCAVPDSGIEREARALVDAVLDLDPDVGHALLAAFERGYLDVPFCLHPDNLGRSRAALDSRGWLRWTRTGSMPIGGITELGSDRPMSSAELLDSLTYVQRKFDEASPART